MDKIKECFLWEVHWDDFHQDLLDLQNFAVPTFRPSPFASPFHIGNASTPPANGSCPT